MAEIMRLNGIMFAALAEGDLIRARLAAVRAARLCRERRAVHVCSDACVAVQVAAREGNGR